MMDRPEVGWDEIDRAEAAIVVWATRWGFPINPEDCEAIAVSAVTAAKSKWSREQIYESTEDFIDVFERQQGRTSSERIRPPD